jgi:hypothetical protein
VRSATSGISHCGRFRETDPDCRTVTLSGIATYCQYITTELGLTVSEAAELPYSTDTFGFTNCKWGTRPRTFLRGAGLAALGIALGGYLTLDGPVWLLISLGLAPDLSMIGCAGPRAGSLSYNIAHTYTPPIALGSFGFWADVRMALLVALIWAGHIGADRLVGYGLKFESGFKNAHLPTQPAPLESLTGSE